MRLSKKGLTNREYGIFAIMSLFSVVLGIVVINSQSNEVDEKVRLYPKLHKYQRVEGRVKTFVRGRRIADESRVYIAFVDGVKFSLGDGSRCTSSSYRDFGYFVQSGDSLIKRYGSDTIHIYRKSEAYNFVLSRIID